MTPFGKKPSLKDAMENLAKIGILVVDSDKRVSVIVREVLESLGFNKILLATDGAEALRIMETERIDMLITDWRMSPMDGINLVKYLRTADNSPNRFLPIIMLTANVERDQVEMARDVGVTEFVIKPFSAKTLLSRIVMLIENPRSFVMNRGFTGPDRRRRNAVPPDNVEKRK
jgi:CheY-like chemotaxis protein